MNVLLGARMASNKAEGHAPPRAPRSTGSVASLSLCCEGRGQRTGMVDRVTAPRCGKQKPHLQSQGAPNVLCKLSSAEMELVFWKCLSFIKQMFLDLVLKDKTF